MSRIISILLIFSLIGIASSRAQDINRVGTAAAQFMKLGAGARAGALGEAAVSIPGDVTSLYWNPAGIASIDRTAFAASRHELYVDLSFNFVGIVQPLGTNGSIGASVIYLDSGEMEITTLDSPNGTNCHFSWEAFAIGLTYSRYVTDRLRLGGTIKYIREGAYHLKAHALAIDVGSLLDTGVLGMKLGMCLSNFGGPMRLAGPSLQVQNDRLNNNSGTVLKDAYLKTEEYPLPLIFRLGLSTQLVGNEGQLMNSENNTLTIAVDAYDPMDAVLRSNLGIEYVWNSILSLRAGYRGISVENDEYDSYNTASYTFGGGIQYDFNVAHIEFDYAFTDFNILGNGHLFSIVLSF